MALKSQVDFAIDVVGEITGNKYPGSFTVKTSLSVREMLKQDEIYRSIIGPDPANASQATKNIASAVSYLAVRVILSPDWWKKLQGGLECDDLNLVAIVNNTAQDVIDAEYKKLAEEAKKAEDILKGIPTV